MKVDQALGKNNSTLLQSLVLLSNNRRDHVGEQILPASLLFLTLIFQEHLKIYKKICQRNINDRVSPHFNNQQRINSKRYAYIHRRIFKLFIKQSKFAALNQRTTARTSWIRLWLKLVIVGASWNFLYIMLVSAATDCANSKENSLCRHYIGMVILGIRQACRYTNFVLQLKRQNIHSNLKISSYRSYLFFWLSSIRSCLQQACKLMYDNLCWGHLVLDVQQLNVSESERMQENHCYFFIFFVLVVSSATLSPFYEISPSSAISVYFFFFSAHFAHIFVLMTLVSSALFFFSTSMFFLFSLLPMEFFPLIFFFFNLLAASISSALRASSFSSFSRISFFVLSMLPRTLGSTVMVSGGSLSSSLCTSDSRFCFLDSKGLFSKVSQKGTPLPGTAMLLNPQEVPKPSKSSNGTKRQLLTVPLGLQVMQGCVCLLTQESLKISMRKPQLMASSPLCDSSTLVTFLLMGQVCSTFNMRESHTFTFSAAVYMYPLWKPMSVIPAPTNNLTAGVPTPGVHHSTVPFALPRAMMALELLCRMTVQGLRAMWSAMMWPVVVSQYLSLRLSQPTSKKWQGRYSSPRDLSSLCSSMPRLSQMQVPVDWVSANISSLCRNLQWVISSLRLSSRVGSFSLQLMMEVCPMEEHSSKLAPLSEYSQAQLPMPRSRSNMLVAVCTLTASLTYFWVTLSVSSPSSACMKPGLKLWMRALILLRSCLILFLQNWLVMRLLVFLSRDSSCLGTTSYFNNGSSLILQMSILLMQKFISIAPCSST